MSNNVLISGMGQCSSLGIGIDQFWEKLIIGESGIKNVQLGETFEQQNIAKITNGSDGMEHYINKALCEALDDAKIVTDNLNNQPIPIVVGSNFSDSTRWNNGESFISPANSVINGSEIPFDIWAISNACSTGVNIIGLAYDLVKSGEVDIAVALGYEFIKDYNFGGLWALRAISKDTIRPFDINRNGTTLGEGCGCIILESEASLHNRKAKMYAQIEGYGISNDAYHFTAPHPQGRGSKNAMIQAIDESGISLDKINHINCHGTGTKHNDMIEGNSIKFVFKENIKNIHFNSIKPSIGHCMGASGIMESIATVLSLNNCAVPPTLNLKEIDKECSVENVSEKTKFIDIEYAMCNAYGFWGCNSSIIFSK